MFRRGFVSHDRGEIYYEAVGYGEVIVFIHGFTLDTTMWRPQIDFFRRNYQVIVYDARGFGRSSLPNGPYNHVADLQALLKHLRIQKAHIVGLSMGGRIATNFTLTYPEMVLSLTLMDAALDGFKNEVDWNVYAKEQGLEKAKENWLNHEIFVTAKQTDAENALRTIVENYSGWHWLHDDPLIIASIPVSDRLHQLNQPTLVMVGEDDLPYFHAIASVLAAKIPKAQKVTVPNAGHMINLEAPGEVNELLDDFLCQKQTKLV